MGTGGCARKGAGAGIPLAILLFESPAVSLQSGPSTKMAPRTKLGIISACIHAPVETLWTECAEHHTFQRTMKSS